MTGPPKELANICGHFQRLKTPKLTTTQKQTTCGVIRVNSHKVGQQSKHKEDEA